MLLSTSTNICAFQPGRERLPAEFCIDVCAAAGYRVLDINLCMAMNPDSALRGPRWREYVEHIGQYASSRGVRFTQSHLPYYDVFSDSVTEQDREMWEELIRRCIVASGMLGVRWAVTHPGTVYGAENNEHVQLERNLAYYARHTETANREGVGIALENDFGPQGGYAYCASVRELRTLVDAFGDPEHIGACYDFGHANLAGGNHRANLNLLGSRLKAVHVQDNHGERDEHLMPFYGSIDWKQAMAGLADIGYTGELTYEIQEFGRFLPADMKHLAVEQSLAIGTRLIEYYETALKNGASENTEEGKT